MASAEHLSAEHLEEVDFDAPAQKGWTFFTKFLLWNIIVWGGVLILLAIIFSL